MVSVAEKCSGGEGTQAGEGFRGNRTAKRPASPYTARNPVTIGLDPVTTGLDPVIIGLDRVTIGLDRVTTGLDRVTISLNHVTIGFDHVTSGLDRVTARRAHVIQLRIRLYFAAATGTTPTTRNDSSPFMNDFQLKQQAMCGTVSRFVTDRATEVAVVPAAQIEAADVVTAHAKTTKALANPVVQTKNVTQVATEAEKQLRTALPALLGPLSSVATKAADVDLLAKSTLRVKQLQRLTPEQLHELADQLLTLGEGQSADILAHYGLAPVLTKLRGYQQALAPFIGQTQDLIDTRTSDNQTAETLLRATMRQVYELDKVMLVFKILNPSLYRDYRQARFVGKRGGSEAKRPRL